MEKLYKYKSLKSFEYLVDIILNKRLFGSKYLELNDPFEAYILGNNIDKKIYEQRANARICSASKTPFNELMWAHYADGHRGYCIEFTPNSSKWEIVNVEYKDTLPLVTSSTSINDVLKNKLKPWEYEKEVRCIKHLNNKDKKNYLPVRISKIYLGIKIDRTKRAFIKKLIKSVDDRIEVVDIKREYLIEHMNE